MKLGDKVKVGPFDIIIEKWSNLQGISKRRYAEFSAAELKIGIDVSHPKIQIIDSLIHEINHAIYWVYKLEESDGEERLVGTMATGWTQVYRDNPWLLKYFAECVK